MAASSILLSASTKNLAPTTIVPLFHNPYHKARSPLTPRCHKLSSLALQLEAESPACRSIHDTLSSIHEMGRIVLPPAQVWTSSPKKATKTTSTGVNKKRSSSAKASTSTSAPIAPAPLQSEDAIEEPLTHYGKVLRIVGEHSEPSEPPLESGLNKMQHRHREVVKLAVETELSAEEIGATLRPEKPLSTITVASYLLLGLEVPSLSWREEEALYTAIGKDRLTKLVKADYWRWKNANGFGQYCTNEERVKGFERHEKERKKVRKELEKGKIDGMEFEVKMQEVQQGWKFEGGPPSIPKGILMHASRKLKAKKEKDNAKRSEETSVEEIFFKRNQDLGNS